MGLLFAFAASCAAAFSNYFMRKSQDHQGSGSTFLTIQLFLSFLVAVLLNPVRTHFYNWNTCMAVFGFAGGIILGFMMLTLNNALKFGPPGLTFASVNSACIMPGILLAIFLGPTFGYHYSFWNGLGSILVLMGLFWAGMSRTEIKKPGMWLSFVAGAFFLHMTGMTWIEGRAFFIHHPDVIGLLIAFESEDAKNQWFLPMLFLAAFLVQIVHLLRTEKKRPSQPEVTCGILGGIANGAATFFLMLSTEFASRRESPMIFPIFAVLVVVFCNLWGQWLYRENVNWKANILCVIGLFIGTLDWSQLA